MRTPSENNGNKKNDHAGERPTAGDDPGSSTAVRKIFKVLCNPQLAVALLNAQLKIRAKARLPWSVRLYGRIYFRAGGEVEFGDGVSLVGTVVPIEIVSHGVNVYNEQNEKIGDLNDVIIVSTGKVEG